MGNDKTKLKRELGLGSAIFAVISLVIGSGIFFKPQAVFTATGAPGLGMFAMFLAGIITLAGGLSTGELAASIPKTGGMPVWLEEAYGPQVGYLAGWMESVLSFPANIAVLCIAFGTQVANLLGFSDAYIGFVGCAVLYFLFIMNALGAKFGGIIGNIFTVGKMVPIAAIIVVGLLKGPGGPARLFPMTDAAHPVATGLGAAMLACMYAYEGWIHVGNISGELKNPKRDLPRAIVLGLTAAMVIYLLIFAAYLFVLPASTLAQSSTPAADVCRALFGQKWGSFISVGILISLFGTINTNILVAQRVPYSMGVQNKLPFSDKFAYLHPKFATPIYSAIWIAFMTTVMIFSGTYNSLTDMSVFVLWIFYSMSFIAVIVLRRKHPELARPYKCPLYPIIPIFAAVGGGYIIISNLIQQPLNVGKGIILTLIGLPIYYLRKNKFRDVTVIDE